ncbi:MAG TPA: hypothetical protein VHV08_16150, partial [Pirellulales bacterium]|nr:hypothetical protein [Pirellulales bacterium]
MHVVVATRPSFGSHSLRIPEETNPAARSLRPGASSLLCGMPSNGRRWRNGRRRIEAFYLRNGVDDMQDDCKADRIELFTFSTPSMRAFHMAWMAFFLCFFAW